MRKTILKEVAFTEIHYIKLELVAGQPTAVVQPMRKELGKLTQEKAQKLIHEEVGSNATVFKTKQEKVVYEMDITDFIKYGKIRKEETPVEDESSSFVDTEE